MHFLDSAATMASNFALTMYNIAPEWLSEGNHTPFHSEHSDPFRFPFTFGPKSCPSKLGCHVGLHATEDVIGTFAGSEGDFLVLEFKYDSYGSFSSQDASDLVEK